MSEDCLAVGTMPLYYRCSSIFSTSNNSYSSMVSYQGIWVFFSNMVHKLGMEKLQHNFKELLVCVIVLYSTCYSIDSISICHLCLMVLWLDY